MRGIYEEVEDGWSTQEPRYCVLRDIKEDLPSLPFLSLGKGESQANGQLSANGNFKSFDGGREPTVQCELPFWTHSLSCSGSWQGDFHAYLNWNPSSLDPVNRNNCRWPSLGSLLLDCLLGTGFLDRTTPSARCLSPMFLLSLGYWSCLLPLFLQTWMKLRFLLNSLCPCSEHFSMLCLFLCE